MPKEISQYIKDFVLCDYDLNVYNSTHPDQQLTEEKAQILKRKYGVIDGKVVNVQYMKNKERLTLLHLRSYHKSKGHDEKVEELTQRLNEQKHNKNPPQPTQQTYPKYAYLMSKRARLARRGDKEKLKNVMDELAALPPEERTKPKRGNKKKDEIDALVNKVLSTVSSPEVDKVLSSLVEQSKREAQQTQHVDTLF